MYISYPNMSQFCAECGSDSAVLCAKLQGDWVTVKLVVGKRDFPRLRFKMAFKGVDIVYYNTFLTQAL